MSTRLQLGLWSGVAGDLDDAIESLDRLLPDVEDILGAAHELGFSVRHQLARWYGARGDTGKAVSILGALVTDQRRVLGDHDYRTLASQGLLSRYTR